MAKGVLRLLLVGVLVTAGLLATSLGLEAAARVAAPEQQHNTCGLPGQHHVLFKANCVSAPMKMAEGPWLRYAYNDCGYRTAESCHNRPPGGLRVAVIGTSTSYGLWVPYPQTWAARVSAALSAGCGHPTDLQNMAFPASHDGGDALWGEAEATAPRAMTLQPDAIVTMIGPVDLGFYAASSAGLAGPQKAAAAPPPRKSLKQRLIDIKVAINAWSSVALFRHWWLSDPGRLVDLSTQSGDTNDFLRSPMTPAWTARLSIADDAFDKVAAAAKARNVPWFVLMVPTAGQAALAAHGPKPGYDPYLLGHEVGDLVRSHGGTFYDLTSDFARDPHLGRDFYVVNGHPTADGTALIAHRVAALLTQQAPAFQACRVGL